MDEPSTKKYAFVLGRERELCFAELKAVLKRFCFDFVVFSVPDNIVFINIAAETQAIEELADVLGGTVKIFLLIEEGNFKGQNNSLKSKIINILRKRSNGKMNYGISSYTKYFTRNFVNNIGLSIKKELKREISLRFVALRDGDELSSIVSLKSKFVSEGAEFGLFDQGIGILLGVSNAEEWSKRDYDKPAGDKRSGMLPPKLARMMINLALGQGIEYRIQNTENREQGTKYRKQETENCRPLVIDPFCGSGNILTEAMMLGCDTFGSDVSAKAVQDSRVNTDWLLSDVISNDSEKSHEISRLADPMARNDRAKAVVAQADATEEDFVRLLAIHGFKLENYADAVVVTEPYLGEPKKLKPTMSAAWGEYKKIKELYISFLKNIKQLAEYSSNEVRSSQLSVSNNKDIALCIVFPLVETSDEGLLSLYRRSVDEIKKIGYTELQLPLIYGRDYQVVKREIVLLTIRNTKGY